MITDASATLVMTLCASLYISLGTAISYSHYVITTSSTGVRGPARGPVAGECSHTQPRLGGATSTVIVTITGTVPVTTWAG